MRLPLAAASILCLALSTACATSGQAPEPTRTGAQDALFETIAALDTEVFSAFNSCEDAGQLEKHAQYFSQSVEFYHDNGGVTWNRDEMLANTRKFACGNFRRELVPGSLRVYPIKDFGAIAQGVHRFCQIKTGACDGAAEFLMVWRRDAGNWSITRVFSYGHRPA